jgi:DNA-binding NtrC family response regulator
MRDIPSLVERAAAEPGGVLIRGELGTGREAVARAVHAAAGLNGAPFVVVDCAADPQRLERDLFGVNGNSAAPRPKADAEAAEAAAVAGLEKVTRASRLVAAAGGTLYLRNLEDAPARIQRKLARILRDREAFVTDAGAPMPIDVRPIAGVTPAVEPEGDEGQVARPLLRRLSGVTIDVPPLRSRRDDIPRLVDHLLRRIGEQRSIPALELSRSARALVLALPWRGNARELRLVLERVVSAHRGQGQIHFEEVLAQVRLDRSASVLPATGPAVTLRQARMKFEREYVAAVLEQHRGRISEAARTLGIQRTNLYRKMRNLRVVPERGRQ